MPSSNLKKLNDSLSVTGLSAALILVCTAFIFAGFHSGFFGQGTNTSTLEFWIGTYISSLPILVSIASLHAATVSYRSQVICWVLLSLTGLLTCSGIYKGGGADASSLFWVITYMMMWVIGITAFLSALINLHPPKRARYWWSLLIFFTPIIALRIYPLFQ